MHVVLVDDDEAFLKLCSRKLSNKKDLEIHTISDPTEMNEYLTENSVDCIVSDYDMPQINGIELCEEVRKENHEIPFILFTSYSDKKVIEKAFEKGVDEYLKKGLGSAQYRILLKKIKNLAKIQKERKNTKKSLKNSEFQKNNELALEKIIDNIPGAIYLQDNENNVILANQKFKQFFSVEKFEDVVGSPIYDKIDLKNTELLKEADSKALKNLEKIKLSKQKFEESNNSENYFEVTKIPLGFGSNSKYILNFISESEGKKREEFLEEVLAASRKMSETKKESQIAKIAVKTMENSLEMPITTFFTINNEENIFEPEVSSKKAEELFDNPKLDKSNSLAGKVFEEGRPKFFESLDQEEEKFNSQTPIKSEIIIPVGENGVLISGSCSKKDFDQKEIFAAELLGSMTEAAIKRAKREKDLEKQNQRLNQFANIISHDLRSPLNTAQGYLELEMDQNNENLEQVQKAHKRIENIIESVLALAKHTEDFEEQKVNMKDVAKKSWSFTESKEEDTLKIEKEFFLKTDEDKLMNILENLFSNSIENSNKNVEVRVGSLEQGFYVEDNGPGIPEEEKTKVLEFGYSNNDSTGFGLSIVEQISNLLGFELTIEDSKEGGARFEFSRQ
jgi:CheY-like chemotaxis protein